MPIYATNKGRESVPAPAGTHVARCIQVIDIGSHRVDFGSGDERTMRKVRIAWELPEEKHVFDEQRGPEPFVVSKEYNLSTNEKSNLRRDLESWRGAPFTKEEAKQFDVSRLLGHPAMLTIMHVEKKNKDGVYAKVTAVTRPPKSVVCPKQILETLEYSVDQGKDAVYEKLPEWLRKTIAECEEWVVYPASTPNADPTPAEKDVPAPDDSQDVPF